MKFIKQYMKEILIIVGITIITLGIYWIVKSCKK